MERKPKNPGNCGTGNQLLPNALFLANTVDRDSILPECWSVGLQHQRIQGVTQKEDICGMILCSQNLGHPSTSPFAFLCASQPPVPSAFLILYLHF